MKPSARLDPIHHELPIHELPHEPMDRETVEDMVRDFAESRVRCAKHASCIGDLRVRMQPGKAIVDLTPCCRRSVTDLKAQLRRLKGLGDDRIPDVVPPGHHLARPGLPPSVIAVTPPMPSVPFTTSGGQRAVSREVAAQFAAAGRLQHISTLNGGEHVEVYSAETANEEMEATPASDGQVPPCTVENIRIRTKGLIAEATKLALKEGRPLSDYAAIVDWDEQVMHLSPAPQTRAMFVEAGGVPHLVKELDENKGETLLIFIFANNRYDRTMRIRGRGFVTGSAGAG